MSSLYARWMYDWDARLNAVSTNRVVRPFDWGLEWTRQWPTAARFPQNGHDPHGYLKLLNQAGLEDSDEFFGYRTPSDFVLDGNRLRFTSPVKTPYSENNTVHGQWFPAAQKPGKRRVAAVVLPHWNASAQQHGALCAGMAKFGINALRVSLPYHDYRMPAELQRADYAVSSNLARTIDATRQAVIDTRCCVDWLEQQGFEKYRHRWDELGVVLCVFSQRPRSAAEGERVRPLLDICRRCGVGRSLHAAHPARAGVERNPGAVARGLGRDQPAELRGALCADGQEASVPLRALRYHFSYTLL